MRNGKYGNRDRRKDVLYRTCVCVFRCVYRVGVLEDVSRQNSTYEKQARANALRK